MTQSSVYALTEVVVISIVIGHCEEKVKIILTTNIYGLNYLSQTKLFPQSRTFKVLKIPTV